MTIPKRETTQGRAFSHLEREAETATGNRLPLPGLYLITPDAALDDYRDRLQQALQAGIRWLQFRRKQGSLELRQREAMLLRRWCQRRSVAFIVNDDLELAASIGGCGIHLGEDDVNPREARRQLAATALIGVSCYDSLARAEAAIADGADYVAFGACYPSTSKTTRHHAGPALLRSAAARGWPTVAIGGIEPHNAAPLLAAGARWLACIGAVFSAPDAVANLVAFNHLFARNAEDPS